MTGRQSKKEEEEPALGTMHELHEKLQNSLLAACKEGADDSIRDFRSKLRVQREQREKKEQFARQKKLLKAQENFIYHSYLHQMWDSPRCVRTAQQAMDQFELITTKGKALEWVKEQILIRKYGLGWVEAHHPWSKGKHTYTAAELLKHLVEVVIPLEQTHKVPAEAPVDLPSCPELWKLGTVAADVASLNNNQTNEATQFRLKAFLQREKNEEMGLSDQLSEMQQFTWKVFDNAELRREPWKIDMLFSYPEEDGNVNIWSKGTVIELIKSDPNYQIVKIKWDDEYIAGGPAITKEKLMKTGWNPDKPKERAWREDLWHKIKQ